MSNTDFVCTKDYLNTLEEAATGFLKRHHAQHLGEQDLFDRAVAHLVTALSAKKPLAENAVARAYGRLRCGDDNRYLDISSSTAHMAMLVDPRTNMTYPVPVALIFKFMIDPRPVPVVH